jgi:hypothetical protein
MKRRNVLTTGFSITVAATAGCVPTAGQTNSGDVDNDNITTYGFESGLEEWTVIEDAFQRTQEYAFEGSFSAGIEATSDAGIDTIAALNISESVQIQRVSFVWKDFTESYGGGILVRNSSGDLECFAGSDNPEWLVIGDNSSDGPGPSYVGESGGYDRWIQTEIEFDWENNEFTVSFEEIQTGATGSEVFALNHGQDVGQIELHGYQARRYEPGAEPETGSCQMYWDSIEIESTEDETTDEETETTDSEDETTDEETETTDSEDETTDDGEGSSVTVNIPGFGISSAIAATGGVSYIISRRIDPDQPGEE